MDNYLVLARNNIYISNQITDADKACRSREISVDLIIIIVFSQTYSYFCYILTSFFYIVVLTFQTFIYHFCLFAQNRLHLFPIRHPVGSYVGYFVRYICNTRCFVCNSQNHIVYTATNLIMHMLESNFLLSNFTFCIYYIIKQHFVCKIQSVNQNRPLCI